MNIKELEQIISDRHFKIHGLEIGDIHSDYYVDFKYYVNPADIIEIEDAPAELQNGLKWVLDNYVLNVKVWQNSGRYNVSFIDDFVNFEPTYYVDVIKYIKHRSEKTVDFNSYEIWKTIRDEIQNQIDLDLPFIDL